jgi:hypothetical protein
MGLPLPHQYPRFNTDGLEMCQGARCVRNGSNRYPHHHSRTGFLPRNPHQDGRIVKYVLFRARGSKIRTPFGDIYSSKSIGRRPPGHSHHPRKTDVLHRRSDRRVSSGFIFHRKSFGSCIGSASVSRRSGRKVTRMYGPPRDCKD